MKYNSDWMFTKSLYWILPAIFLTFLTTSCTNTNSSQSGEDDSGIRKNVIIFYPPNGLGDSSYNDNICYGVHKTENSFKTPLRVTDYSPDSWTQSKNDLELFLKKYGELYEDEEQNKSLAKKNVLFIFCDQDYIPLVEKAKDSFEEYGFLALFLDSPKTDLSFARSLYISTYGASYLAGLLSRTLLPGNNQRVCLLLANENQASVVDAYNGFIDGFEPAEDERKIINKVNAEDYEQAYENNIFFVTKTDSDDDQSGYNSEYTNYVNIRFHAPAKQFSLFFPMCRGGINGFLRYHRETIIDSFYTIGVETDCSIYTRHVPFSLVRHMDRAAELCLSKWIKEGDLPLYQQFGLESGYVNIVLSPDSTELLKSTLESNISTAIEKERLYDENSN